MKAPQVDYARPTWAHARKDAIGTSLGSSRLWFTVAEGILTEVYYPRVDIPQIRDLGFIIADDKGFWVELRRMGNYELSSGEHDASAVRLVHRHPRFTFTLEICPSQNRDTLLLRFRLEGDATLRPYALLAARLGGDAENNLARISKHNGRTVLCAEQGPFALALLAKGEDGYDAWGRCSVGALDASDGWQDFRRNGHMSWEYDSAGPGAVSLMGELPRHATLALGLSTSQEAAATLAMSSLMEGFEHALEEQNQAWSGWIRKCHVPQLPDELQHMLLLSSMVLKIHQDKTFTGAMVASLSVPWGESSQSRGGYHLVWCRDLVEAAGAMLAVGALDEAREVLCYLIATQQEDGHWFQNQWLGGKAFWHGVQLDEAAFPVLLASALQQRDALGGISVTDMVRRALTFIAREGPSSAQDRWEEDSGVNTFTLAIAIAALVEGSTFLSEEAGQYALSLADHWNAHLENWTVSRDTPLARRFNVSAYYIRTAPADILNQDSAMAQHLIIKNRLVDPDLPASEQIGTEFLQLVRYGLRSADDPLILDSLKVVDQMLKTETPNGPVWHRYNGDGYGEHNDGSPYNGTGRGRGWPLLVGERGHYALMAGEDCLPYLQAMAKMAGPTGLLPEQVWDWDPIPEYRLEPGKPTGSAMPLAWAHGEFIKLCYSRALSYPVDRPQATWLRYRGTRPDIAYTIWGPQFHPQSICVSEQFFVALKAHALVHWGHNNWQGTQDSETRDTGIGVHIAEISLSGLKAGDTVQFTFFWIDEQKWQGQDYEVKLLDPKKA